MKIFVKQFALIFVVFVLISAAFSMYKGGVKPEQIGLEQLVNEINAGQVESIDISGDILSIKLKDNKIQSVTKEAGQPLSELLKSFGVSPEKMTAVKTAVKTESGTTYWINALLPILLPFLLIAVFIYFMMRQVQGANKNAMMFGQSQAKEFDSKGKEKVSFKDVAGAKEAKEELKEVVEFLKQPKKFLDLGARIPRGVLLLGSPGTGKTLLARAVAGEANVPFLSISGSEFVEMFVGVGASRVRDLFKRAKKMAPCIIFVDEIDAVGRRRGAGLGGSHDEREQTLNQILVEMDGFDQNANVIVIAATNRPDVLDPALLRPGRFDRQVMLDEPDLNDREAILQVHVTKKPLDTDVDLRKIAQRTPGFSGADLMNLLNEAAILTARHNKKLITMDDVIESIEKVMLGPARRSRVITQKEKDITAYHEAGHAVVAHLLPNTDPVHKISIISRGRAGGYTLKLPIEDRHMRSRTEFIEEVAVLLGGNVAEQAFFGDVTTGASSDLRRATEVARRLVTDYGMSAKLGLRTFGQKEEMVFLGREIHEQRDYSEKTAELIDIEISAIIEQATKMAEDIITKQADKIKAVVAELVEKETIEQDRFIEIVGLKKGEFANVAKK
ncbi:MAG: ATP-dependent zinc metalloprotease FtsH [bacterium]